MKTTRILLLTILAFALALCASRCGAAVLPAHLVGTVYMVAYSPPPYVAVPREPEYQADFARAKADNITLIDADTNGWTAEYQEREPLIDQAASADGMTVLHCEDLATFDPANTGAFVKSWYADPATLRESDGEPVILFWGGTLSQYTAIQVSLAVLAAEGMPLHVWANQEAAYLKFPWITGLCSYNIGDTAPNLAAKVAREAKELRAGDELIQGVSAYYSARGKTYGGGWPYMDTVLTAVDAAHPAVEMYSTWNDEGEADQLEPNPPAKNPEGVALTDRSALVVKAKPLVAAAIAAN